MSRRGVRRLILGLLLAAALGAAFVWRAATRRAESYLTENEAARGAVRELPVTLGATVRLGAGHPADVDVAAPVRAAHDGVMLSDGSLLVATGGGLVAVRAGALALALATDAAGSPARTEGPAQSLRAAPHPPSGPGPRPQEDGISYSTHLDGLPGLDLTAATRLGARALLGDRTGVLALVDGERVTPVRIGLPRPTPVADLVAAADVVYVLYTGLGVVAFDGRRAVDVGATAKLDLTAATALCVGTGGLLVGTREGVLYQERGGGAAVEFVRRDTGLGVPITALACPGAETPDVYLGTPFGLYRLPAGSAAPPEALRRDLFVTSILPLAAGLYASSFDDGVWLLDPVSGRVRAHELEGQTITRLRALTPGGAGTNPGQGPAPDTSERVVASSARGMLVRAAGRWRPLPAPAATPKLSAGHVTALARDGAGALWVGTFDGGIDVLDGALRSLRHLPEPAGAGAAGGLSPLADARDDQVNALLYRPATREMLAASVRGVTVYRDGVPVGQLGPDEDAAARPPHGSRDGSGDSSRNGSGGRSGDGVAALVPLPGGLALATSHGVVLAEGAKRRALYTFHGLANNHVYALASLPWAASRTPEAEGGTLAAGTLGGLSLIELGTRPRITKNLGAGPGRLGAAWIAALAADPEGLYVGTYGGGVQRLRPDGSVEDLSAPIGRFHVNPGALVVERGTLWVGTLEAGLLACDLGERRWRRLERLLPPGGATAILVDGDTFYIGGPAGLVRASRSAVEAALVPIGTPLHAEEAP
ncbi:MAG TPA: two-component regulator propeller domain-containing protein [Polyangia bacterium]|nr:two-component regulator propeller domain-containing protein [Polyangia bacterium]